MAKTRSHKDLEYHVTTGHEGRTQVFKNPKDALAAVAEGCIHSGEAVLDVVVWSASAASFYGGSDAADRYREDPDASVFDRFQFRCNAQGSVP